MSPDRQVYLLNPKELSPETIAVTFAKTSRSPESFREIAAELTDEKSAKFHEKWVVGYGHASVAEHAVLHIAIENVSRLAIEAIESNRLASYTEKSTRYQKWNPDAFYLPPELTDPALLAEYRATCSRLFDGYQHALPLVRAVVEAELPRQESESEAVWERRLRSEYIDVCRYFLPAASLANVGLTANARVIEHAIQKLLSDPLAEARAIGAEICQVAQREIPTLVKYADRSAYLEETAQNLENEGRKIPAAPMDDWCRLAQYDPEGENRVLAAALYRFGGTGFDEALETVNRATPEERIRLAGLLLGNLGRFDIPLRELEHTLYTFDLVVDQGGYFEIKRHRMMTQTPQALTPHLGYALPRRLVAAGVSGDYCEALEQVCQTYEKLAQVDRHVAGYLVPNGFKRRVLLTFNLRSAFHFCRLRSAPNAHFAVRRVAQRIADQIRAVHPALGTYLATPTSETWQSIEKEYFSQA